MLRHTLFRPGRWIALVLGAVTLVTGISLTRFAAAQTTFGTLVGNVADQSGAALPNATVKLTNNGTNEARTMQTTMAGIYSRLLDRIEAEPRAVLAERISLSPGQKAWVAARALIGAAR